MRVRARPCRTLELRLLEAMSKATPLFDSSQKTAMVNRLLYALRVLRLRKEDDLAFDLTEFRVETLIIRIIRSKGSNPVLE